MSKGFTSNPRMALLAGAVLLCFAGLGARLVQLHIYKRPSLMKFVDQARRQIVPVPARRGDIVDLRGRPLATSVTKIRLAVDPTVIRAEDAANLPSLAALAGMSLPELQQALAVRHDPATGRPIQWVKLRDQVDQMRFEEIKALRIKGVLGEPFYQRTYPQAGLASHVLGFVNRENTAVTGIELALDAQLRAHDGWREIERDGRRKEMAQFSSREVPAADGYNLGLSIDSVVQNMIEEELQRLANEFRPEKATIIVSDARTGFILGLGNHPSYNPNEYGKAKVDALRNLAVTDVYEPGSVFKIVAAAGALEEGLVNARSTFDCTLERISYKGRDVRLPGEDHAILHPLNLAEIIAKSSNKGAVQLAMRLGDQQFYKYVRAFGFGERTGFPGGGEVPGILAAPEKWDGLTIASMPIGHAVGVTVMQMHQAMSVIASGGVLLRPQVVEQIRDTRGDLVHRFRAVEARRVISEDTARTMADYLMGVASPIGTARNAAIPLFQVAGKTGTTRKLIEGRYSDKEHVASFVGFFPASRPAVVISVVVDNARVAGGTAYGSTVAAPAFQRLARQLINHLQINPVVEGVGVPLAQQGGRP